MAAGPSFSAVPELSHEVWTHRTIRSQHREPAGRCKLKRRRHAPGYSGASMTDWIAIYGATLSTLIAGAQGVAWLRRTRSRISVQVHGSHDESPTDSRLLPGVVVSVTNRSEYSVLVRHIGFGRARRLWPRTGTGGACLVADSRGCRFPAEVQPHDSASWWFANRDLRRFLRALHSIRICASVSLTAGELFWSPPFEPLEDVPGPSLDEAFGDRLDLDAEMRRPRRRT